MSEETENAKTNDGSLEDIEKQSTSQTKVNTCSICLETISDDRCVQNICSCKELKYHEHCFNEWISYKHDRRSCEICKSPYKKIKKRNAISWYSFMIAITATLLYGGGIFALAFTSNNFEAFVFFVLFCVTSIPFMFIGSLIITLRIVDKIPLKTTISMSSPMKYIWL